MAFNFTIQRRLLALSLLGLAFVVAVGATGYVAVQRLATAADSIDVAGRALKSQLQADQAHDALRGDVLAALLAGTRKASAEEKTIRVDLKAHADLFRDSLQKLTVLPLDETIRQAVDKVRPALASYVDSASSVVALAFTDGAAAQAGMEGFTRSFKTVEMEMGGLSELIEAHARDTEAQCDATAAVAKTTIMATVVLALVLLTAAGWYNSGRIVQPIKRAVQIAETVAAGNLGSHIDVQGSDETAQLLAALKRMSDNLAGVVGTVRSSSDSIATGAGEISSGNLDLSRRTEEQASSLQQTAASMEQISTALGHNADTAREAAQLSGSASAAAQQGGRMVGQMVATMNEIAQASRKISDIIGVIDGIAFQTNILALNAAVEAARAGEQGRGFAVVASEVRSLAQRSATAAREIKGLIHSSVEKVDAGSRQAGDVGHAMNDMVSQVQRVTQLISEISTATLEQSTGVGQVSHALTQLDQVTQQNAALVEQSAAAAESLHQQSQRMVQAVAQFRLEAQPA